MRPYDLKAYEVNTVLRFFMYSMPMEQRSQLVAEFPVIYNKLVGSEVVEIKKERDELRVKLEISNSASDSALSAAMDQHSAALEVAAERDVAIAAREALEISLRDVAAERDALKEERNALECLVLKALPVSQRGGRG